MRKRKRKKAREKDKKRKKTLSLNTRKKGDFFFHFRKKGVSLVTQMVENLPAVRETQLDPWVGKIP